MIALLRRLLERLRGPEFDEKAVQRDDYLAGYFSVRPGEPERQPTPEEIAEAEASFEEWWADWLRGCDRCGRRGPELPIGSRLQEMGRDQRVCIDCFVDLTR